MKKSHQKAISQAMRFSWRKGGASRIAYEKRMKANHKKKRRV